MFIVFIIKRNFFKHTSFIPIVLTLMFSTLLDQKTVIKFELPTRITNELGAMYRMLVGMCL